MSEDLFREVDEEVRQDRFQQFWKRYGLYFAVAAGLIVLITVGVVLWKDFKAQERLAASDRFLAALNLEGTQPDQAVTELTALAEEGTTGYRLLARFRAAALLAGQGDTEGAVAQYDAIAGDSGVDDLYRDLARLQAVMQGMPVMAREAAESRLEPLLDDANPWRFSARELQAAVALNAGATAAARDLLQTLVDDLAAPPGIRGRAAELLAAIGE